MKFKSKNESIKSNLLPLIKISFYHKKIIDSHRKNPNNIQMPIALM